MKKSTMIIIIIISSLVVLGTFTAAGILLVKRIAPLMERSLEQSESNKQAKAEENLRNLSSKYNARNWTEDLKTNYSFEVKDKIKLLANQSIVFKGSLYDIVKENGEFFALLQDEDLPNAPFSIIYKMKCTQVQVQNFIDSEASTSEESYAVFAVAAKIEKVTELPQKEEDIWSQPVIIQGILLDFTKFEQPLDY